MSQQDKSLEASVVRGRRKEREWPIQNASKELRALHSSCLLLGSLLWTGGQKTVQVWDTCE